MCRWWGILMMGAGFLAEIRGQEIEPVAVNLGKPEVVEGRRVWKTANFEMDADAAVPVEAMERLAVLAESTAAALRAHPLPLWTPPRRTVPRISVFSDAESYEQAGAVKGTAGYYQGRGGARVLIRADFFLNAVVAERTGRKPEMDEDLAVHELVHLGMHGKLGGLPQWFVDGIAEYFASAHVEGGRFSFVRMHTAVSDHLFTKLGRRNVEMRLLPVSQVVGRDEREWTELMLGLPPEQRYPGYATALLVTHYYLNGGPVRLEEIREMLEQAEGRRRLEEIVKREETGRMEVALKRFWRDKGLVVGFEGNVE